MFSRQILITETFFFIWILNGTTSFCAQKQRAVQQIAHCSLLKKFFQHHILVNFDHCGIPCCTALCTVISFTWADGWNRCWRWPSSSRILTHCKNSINKLSWVKNIFYSIGFIIFIQWKYKLNESINWMQIVNWMQNQCTTTKKFILLHSMSASCAVFHNFV